jgi:hypothetical protein
MGGRLATVSSLANTRIRITGGAASWVSGRKVVTVSGLLGEMEQINELARLMGKPPLFREMYQDDKRPRGFGYLIRPTAREFTSFVGLLDKMLSDNINRRFLSVGRDV